VAQAVERGRLTAVDIASLRALLRDADRVDALLIGFSDTIQGVITWLARAEAGVKIVWIPLLPLAGPCLSTRRQPPTHLAIPTGALFNWSMWGPS
jgi:hypothetical protein